MAHSFILWDFSMYCERSEGLEVRGIRVAVFFFLLSRGCCLTSIGIFS